MDIYKLVSSLSDEELTELSNAVWKEKQRRFDDSLYPLLTETEKDLYLNFGKIKAIIAYKLRTKLNPYVCQMVVEKSMAEDCK